MGRNPKLSPEQKEDICREYIAGKTYSQLAGYYGTHLRTIFDILEEAGLREGGPRLSNDQRKKICEEYREGTDLYQLAKDYGIDLQDILKLLERSGINRRRDKPVMDEEKEIYHSFCEEGLSMRSLRRKYHRGNGAIRKVIGKHNLFNLVDLYSKCVGGVRK